MPQRSTSAEIGLIRPATGSRQVFEEEYIVKTAQQGILLDVIEECPPFFCKLLLHAADEDADGGHATAPMKFIVDAPEWAGELRSF